MADIERCELCGHADSVHNELGYCRVNKRAGDGRQCPCDGTRRTWEALG